MAVEHEAHAARVAKRKLEETQAWLDDVVGMHIRERIQGRIAIEIITDENGYIKRSKVTQEQTIGLENLPNGKRDP